MSADECDLKEIIEKALTEGAVNAISMPASAVVVDPRVRMKCQVPLCKNYGQSLMCPPNIMTPDEFEKALNMFSDGVLVQWEFVPDEKIIDSVKGGSIGGLDGNEAYERMLRKAFKEVMVRLNSLEAEAMRRGYRFATALSGGPCSLCDECVGKGGRCRHPFQARPSMEAVGIDVIATAENAGIPLEYPASKRALLTGLLLVD